VWRPSPRKEKDRKALVAKIASYADAPISLDAMSLGPMFLFRKPLQVNDIIEVLDAAKKGRVVSTDRAS